MKTLLRYILLLLIVQGVQNTNAQVDNIDIDHPVYGFLRSMYVAGLVEQYDDYALPMSRKNVLDLLDEITRTDCDDFFILEQTKYYRDQLAFDDEEKSEWNVNPGGLLFSEKPILVYEFRDSNFTFRVNPFVEVKTFVGDFKSVENQSATIIPFGGRITASYKDWLSMSIFGWNGQHFGNRMIARYDKRVAQSLTFNKTGRSNFDGTEGYIRAENDIFSLELGRTELTRGVGNINKLVLDRTPQPFDYISFSAEYKSLRYSFLHGWLVTQPKYVGFDSYNGDLKIRDNKYIAMSRLGFVAINRLSFGISQVIIYANRGFEAAYLNPFLFYESAQRSLNDTDNSFLVFDGSYISIAGVQIHGSAMFDDINFDRLFKGEWTAYNNGFVWQCGMKIAYPILPAQLSIELEYMQLRPYAYTHAGIGESLTYTNNGYMLGADVQPNSTLFSARVTYSLSPRIRVVYRYDHYLHGANKTNEDGYLIKNYGGDVMFPPTLYDDYYADLLDGELEVRNTHLFQGDYQMSYNIRLFLQAEYRSYKTPAQRDNQFTMFIGFSFGWF